MTSYNPSELRVTSYLPGSSSKPKWPKNWNNSKLNQNEIEKKKEEMDKIE
jgi:hypothetical protein